MDHQKISNQTIETELSVSMPDGYTTGKTKYVVVFGTVMSGLGKGVFSSSLAKLLQDSGIKVSPVKLEGYLNEDSGTLNPFRHGEVFVLDDGTECDMDLGTYERMLNQNLTRDNFITSGQILRSVLDKERHGEYLGRDVQMIPHVTGEVKYRIRQLAQKTKADVIFVEIGGTAGDLENSYYIEAMRQLAFEEGEHSVCFVALTYIISPPSLGEQKSKAAQLGIGQLLSRGIQPYIIACRSTKPVSDSVREKIALYTNVPYERVISMHDTDNIYKIPDMLYESNIHNLVIQYLNIQYLSNQFYAWHKPLSQPNFIATTNVGIAGKYTAIRDCYASILHALDHAATSVQTKINIKWINTELTNKDNVAEQMKDLDGLIVPGGFGTRGMEGKILCTQYARENKIPFLGLCYGMQIAVIEFARNVLGWRGANSTEVDSDCSMPVVTLLPDQHGQQLGGTMRLGLQEISIHEGTFANKIFNDTKTQMRFRHRYEINPIYTEHFEREGMIFSGFTADGQIKQIVEIVFHPFFIATQGHPEFSSRPSSPHPMFCRFVWASLSKRQNAR